MLYWPNLDLSIWSSCSSHRLGCRYLFKASDVNVLVFGHFLVMPGHVLGGTGICWPFFGYFLQFLVIFGTAVTSVTSVTFVTK